MRSIHFYAAAIMVAAASMAAPAALAQKPVAAKFGALAVDRSQGFVFAWAYDHPSRKAATDFALEECRSRNGECSVVVEFSGEGCAAYETLGERDGTAYGWGTGVTREVAQSNALQQCNAFADGAGVCSNHVWACNSADAAPFKVLREDAVKPRPAATDCLVQFDADEENANSDWVNRYRSPVYRLTRNDCPSAPASRYHSYTWDTREPGKEGSEYQPVNKDPKLLARGIAMVQGFHGWLSGKQTPGAGNHFRPYLNVYVTAVKEDILSDMRDGVGQSDSDRQHGICAGYLPPGIVPVATLGAERCRSWLR